MDIDKLFESESLDGIADNVFGVVNNSVSEVKEMQRKKVAENVQLVVNALKKIESDISSRYDSVGNALEKRIITIKDGRDGADGRDGRNGKDGKNGRDGAPGPRGADGKNGLDGADGTDGVSVTNAHIDFDGSLVISLSSGQEINVGEVVAPALAEQIKVITNGGGTSQSVIDTLASLQAQITALGTAAAYKGLWNASTNTPTLTSSVGTSGNFYIVSVAGSTNLNGITNWGVGDWAIYNGTAWQRVEGGAAGNFTTVTASSLTSGRVTYAGTAGLLQDSANLTFNGTTLTANTIGAFTLSGTVAGGGNQLNNVIIGTTTPLAGAFTTLSATGLISSTGGTTNAMAFTGGTTNYQYISMANTTANMTLGVERSTGGGLIVGSTGYDVALSNSGGGISFGVTGNALGMRISSTGLAVTGTLSATGGSASIPFTVSSTAADAYFGFRNLGTGGVYWTLISTNNSSGAGGGTLRVFDNTNNKDCLSIKADNSVALQGATVKTGTGITFPATQSASTNANTLDDYEEGTFTPTDGSGAGLSLTSLSGIYTKIGNLVTYVFRADYPVTANASQAYLGLGAFAPITGATNAAGALWTNNSTAKTCTASDVGYARVVFYPANSITGLLNSQLSGSVMAGSITYQTS